MKVFTVPVLNDNYAYIVQSDTETAIIDPGEATPVLEFLNEHLLQPDWIINTHKHGDHIGGNLQLMDAFDCKLAAPAECDGEIDTVLTDGDVFRLGNIAFDVMLTKGHTAGHVVLFEPTHKILFAGDTLFAMGCGRLFEGTADEMFAAMQKIKSLPKDTKIYCGHEYTANNAKFARYILPQNTDIANRYDVVKNQKCTMPTLLEQELKTNPFLIADTSSRFAEYRRAKDNY